VPEIQRNIIKISNFFMGKKTSYKNINKRNHLLSINAQSSGMYMNADSYNKYSQYTKEKDSMNKDGDATRAHVAKLDHSMMCRKLK
jgi:hypothetical protein